MEGTDLGGEQQFCLRWNNFQANITSQFEALRDDEDFVDVTLACEGHRLEAHKVVLSACSPYFKELFKNNPCPHPIIFMRDCEVIHIAALLEFMYAGEVNISQAQLSSFLKTAEALQIRGLTDSSEKNESKTPTVKHQSSQLRNLLCGRQQTSPAKDTCQNVNESKDTYQKTVKHYSQSRRAARSTNDSFNAAQPFNGISDRNVFTSAAAGSNNKCDFKDTIRLADGNRNEGYHFKLSNSLQSGLNDSEMIESGNINPFALAHMNSVHGEIQHEMIEPKLEVPDYVSDDEIKQEKTFNVEGIFGTEGAQLSHSFLNLQGDVAGTSQDVKSENEGCGIDFSKKSAFRRSWLNLSSDLPSLSSGKHDSTPPKLIKLGEGIELLEEQIRAVKWADYRKLTRSLAALLFSPAELATCSVTGQRWSRAGLEERPTKPPLDRHKVQAIISYVSSRFPAVEVSRIKQVLAYKCKENCTALRMKSVSDNTSQQSGGGGGGSGGGGGVDGGCTASDLFGAKP